MNILHIAPGCSAAGSLRQALEANRLQDNILAWPDDLSCGPIDSDCASVRAEWWGYDPEDWNREDEINEFWDLVIKSESRLIVWFSRHSASELAFFLNWTDRLQNRQYAIIDPAGQQISITLEDGSKYITEPTRAVSRLRADALASLLGTERELTETEKSLAQEQWRKLKSENAPFRIITQQGLVSAPADYFDSSLLDLATSQWQKLPLLIYHTMKKTNDPYDQVSTEMLQTRVVHLVEAGLLLAAGDPWDMRYCSVRLPPC